MACLLFKSRDRERDNEKEGEGGGIGGEMIFHKNNEALMNNHQMEANLIFIKGIL